MDTSNQALRGQPATGWRALRGNIIAAAIVFLGMMALVAGAFHLARGERKFAVDQWERRLRVSISDPVAKVADWLGQGKRTLAEVTANDTVKIYLSELEAASFDATAIPRGDTQRAFVSSYIVSAGTQGPFAPIEPSAPAGQMARQATAGLALFDGQRHLVASTPGYKPSAKLLAFFIRGFRRGQSGPIVLILGGQPTVVFFRPIKPMQAASSASLVGYAIASRDVDNTLRNALATPLAADGGRVVLLARDGDRARYLAASDTRDMPSPAQEMSLAGLSGDLVAARSPGRLQRAPDLSGQAALLFGDTVDGSPLVLVASVPQALALAGIEQRERALLTALLLALVAIVAVAIAFNRHLAGVAATQRADAARRENDTLARREALLKAVVNAHPGALLLIRDGRTVALASARFAGEIGTDAAALVGKPVETVLPSAWRPAVLELLQRRSESTTVQTEFTDAQQRSYLALVLSLSDSAGQPGAALVLVDEITEQVQARERRAQVYRGIVAILLEAIDQRDSTAAAHSRRTGALARAIALRLGEGESDVETAVLAGNLQGVGKLFVPEALLRKTTSLSAEDRRTIDDAAQHWLGLLAQISIDYPVAAVSRMAHEIVYAKAGGGGNDSLLRSAYIVAAANAFVALTSPRAYRPARSAEDAIGELTKAIPRLPADVLKALNLAVAAPTVED